MLLILFLYLRLSEPELFSPSVKHHEARDILSHNYICCELFL